MPLPPLPLPLLHKAGPGWAIDGEHACSSYIHGDSALPYLESQMGVGNGNVSSLLLDYISTHTASVFDSSTFLGTSLTCLQAVLSHPALSLPEDAILLHVMRYALHRTGVGVGSANPALWSPDERNLMMPVLSKLVPCLALMSLSALFFLRYVEPLELLSVESLTFKYKYDALLTETLASGRSEREMVLEMYEGSASFCLPPTSTHPRARPGTAVSESAHPHESGNENELERVSVAKWTGKVLVEFDRRSCVAADARLSFYGDSAGRALLADWSHLWRGGGVEAGGRKYVVFEGYEFWVGFKCPARPEDGHKWGWKLRVKPIID